jgi:ABC-type amino acid transport substrate-binding protein
MKSFKKKFLSLILIIFLFSSCSKNSFKKNEIIFSGAFVYPKFYIKTETNELTGFSVEVAKLVAEKIGMEAKFEILNLKEILPAINSGSIDSAINLVPSDKRRENFDFSKIYLYDESYFVVRGDKNHIINFESSVKESLVFGVFIGSIYDDFLSKYEKNIKLIRFDSPALLLEAFKGNIIDCFFEQKTAVDSYIESDKMKNFKIIPEDLKGTEVGAAFMFKKNNQKLKNQINKAIVELEKNGELEKLKKKYNLT